MKCPYQDIGCWHIDDVSHDCEARSKTNCPHEYQDEPKDSRRKSATEDDEE
jgi:hypothetical protein